MTWGPGEGCHGGLGLVLQLTGGPTSCVVQGGVLGLQGGGWGPFWKWDRGGRVSLGAGRWVLGCLLTLERPRLELGGGRGRGWRSR